MSTPHKQFAPLPPRVLGGTRLTASELRVLGAVARYERFARNGSGCGASNATIATVASVAEKSVSRAYNKLARLGYLRSEQSKTDNRRFQRFIIWDEDVEAIGNEPVTQATKTRWFVLAQQPQSSFTPDKKYTWRMFFIDKYVVRAMVEIPVLED